MNAVFTKTADLRKRLLLTAILLLFVSAIGKAERNMAIGCETVVFLVSLLPKVQIFCHYR